MPTLTKSPPIRGEATAELTAAALQLGPGPFLRSFGWIPYDAQDFIYSDIYTPTLTLATRQFGKTTGIAGLCYYVAHKYPGSLSGIVCPDQDKSKKLIERLSEIAIHDPGHKGFLPDSTEEKGIGKSKVRAFPGTVKGVVGDTAKMLIFDEAGLCPRELQYAASPMQAHVENPISFSISSAWWKQGWFWEAWEKGTGYKKIIVRAKWDIVDGQLVPARPLEDFQAEWKEKGVYAFYSDYPTKAFLEQKLTEQPEWVIRQQYFCEFQEIRGAVLNDEFIDAAFSHKVKPLFKDDDTESVEKSFKKPLDFGG